MVKGCKTSDMIVISQKVEASLPKVDIQIRLNAKGILSDINTSEIVTASTSVYVDIEQLAKEIFL